jgi:hypothetical protein
VKTLREAEDERRAVKVKPQGGLSKRDLLMLMIGTGGLAVVLSIGMAVFAIVKARGGF